MKRKILKSVLISLMLHLGFVGVHAQAKLDKVVKAIAQVESKNNERVVSNNKVHVGLLQISKITVDECNKIIGKKKYSYNDRYSREKSIEMFYIIQDKYNSKYDVEKAIRIWNGGPFCKDKRKTDKYYKRVMKVYVSIKS